MEANITELEIKLLTLLKAEPRISAAAVASQLEIRIDTVKEYLHRLKGKGFLVREGNTRSGHWIVVEQFLSRTASSNALSKIDIGAYEKK